MQLLLELQCLEIVAGIKIPYMQKMSICQIDKNSDFVI